jgi:hypothetical protein
MSLDLIYQLISIGLITFALLYFWDKLCGMRYSFWRIVVRMIFYHDFEPADWLIGHLYYIGFLLLVIGHMFSLTGLIEQIGTNQLHNKPTAFFISPLFNQIGLVLSIVFILNREHIRIKRLKRA